MTGTEARTRLPSGAARDAVIAWLDEQEPGRVFHYVALADELMINETSVNYTLSRLSRRPDDPDDPVLATGSRRGWYKLLRRPEEERRNWNPVLPPEPPGELKTGDMLEVIGTARDGKLLLRDEHQRLWKAEELDL